MSSQKRIPKALEIPLIEVESSHYEGNYAPRIVWVSSQISVVEKRRETESLKPLKRNGLRPRGVQNEYLHHPISLFNFMVSFSSPFH